MENNSKTVLANEASKMRKIAQKMLDRGDNLGKELNQAIMVLERKADLRRPIKIASVPKRTSKPGTYNYKLAYEGYPGLDTNGLSGTPDVAAGNDIDMELNTNGSVENDNILENGPETLVQDDVQQTNAPVEKIGHPDIEPFVDMTTKEENNAPSGEVHTAQITFEAKEGFPAEKITEKLTNVCKELGVKIRGINWTVKEMNTSKVSVH